MGRGQGGGPKPRVLTEEEKAQVEGLASVLSQDQMADYFGMTRPTLAAIMVREPEVALLYKRGRSKAIGAVAQGLLQRARDGDTASAIFYLKTQAGWRETAEPVQEEAASLVINLNTAKPVGEIRVTRSDT